MTKRFSIYGLTLFLAIFFFTCDEYIRTNVEDSIYVNHQSLRLFVGEKVQLIASPTDGAYQYNWNSENPEIATVTSDGLVEGLDAGDTEIIVSANGTERKIPLTSVHRKPLEDVSFDITSLSMKIGDTKRIQVFYIPDDANDIPDYEWYSNNEDVAIVNEIGDITAVRVGNTTIVYTIGDIVRMVTIKVE